MPSGPADSIDFAHSWRSDGVSAVCHDALPIGAISVALLLGTYGLSGLPVDLPLLVAGGCGTALVYLVDRVWVRPPEDRINHPKRVAWIRRHSFWVCGEMAVLVAAGGAAVLYLETGTWLLNGGLAGIAGLHVLSRLRESLTRGGLWKPVAIAGTWAVGAALLPVVEAGASLGVVAVLLVLYRFLFVLPNLILADWSDRKGDRAVGLGSWTARWTGEQVRWGATILLLAALVGAGGAIIAGAPPLLLGIDAVGPVLMIGVVWGSDFGTPTHALLADLVVGWPILTFLAARMIV